MIHWPSKVTEERVELVSEKAYDLDLKLLLKLADTCRELLNSGLYHEVVVDYDFDMYDSDGRIRILGISHAENPNYTEECLAAYEGEKKYLNLSLANTIKSLKKKLESKERLITRQSKTPLREDLYLQKSRELDLSIAALDKEMHEYEDKLQELEKEYKERSV